MMPSVRLAVLAACVLLLGGCGDGRAPTEALPDPAPGALRSTSHAGPEVQRLARFDRKPAVTVAWAKKWIGPAGGRLDFAGFALEVPPGAVDRVTQFSIRLPVDPQGSEYVVAEFGPHGQTFARPVAIELPYAGTSIFGAEPHLAWWDPGRRDWVLYPTEVVADGQRIRTRTDHFSTFGSLAVMGGTILLSGG